MPAKMQDILTAMTGAGLPKADVHLLQATSTVDGGQVTWTVKSTEKSCLKAAVEEPTDDASARFPPAEITLAKISGFADLAGLKASKVLFAVEFDGS